MNKRFFLLVIIGAAVLLTGWIYYLNTNARESEPIEQISAKWWGSAHADDTAEAFVHWDEDEPVVVPQNCAKCHSGEGFLDFLGVDGSAPMVVDQDAAIGSLITCEVCHNAEADALTVVSFVSGVEINLGEESALCGTCHSSRASGSTITAAVTGFGDDDVVPEQGFIQPHYAYAATTMFGSEAAGGYEYDGKTYVNRFDHADGVQSCTECHDPHSLHINDVYKTDANLCAACHSNVSDYSDYRDVFVDGVDYDGDGTVEGVFHEIQGMQAVLMQAINLYSAQEIGEAAGWADQFPYIFKDLDKSGAIEESEAAFPNAYNTFTPRLMRAAYNFQFSEKDKAGYVHNGKYVLQLLYDAIDDLSQFVDVPVENMIRPGA